MSPLETHEPGAYEKQLIAQVTDSLSMHMMENAKFMAERLHADFPNEVRHAICGPIGRASVRSQGFQASC
jgi:hypothetical protein